LLQAYLELSLHRDFCYFRANLLQYHISSLLVQPSNTPVSLHSAQVLKWREFLHVGEKLNPADREHPCQGALPYLKLVTQPSSQVFALFSIFAILSDTDIGFAEDA
jgi:hypothetical protein